MTLRERILAVYRGETPDVVPFMLDLSHWFYHKNRLPWDLSQTYERPEHALIDYHKHVQAGFYLANLASFYSVSYPEDVVVTVAKSADGREITWRYETPLGAISRTRRWEQETYAWAIPRWGIQSEQELKILGYALSHRKFTPRWDRYHAWTSYVGECGVVYMPVGYSAIGYLLNYWLGVAGTIYATVDWHETMHEVVNAINANGLECVNMLCQSPAEVIFMGDNFSSDLQPRSFFDEWSKPFYTEAIRRIHAAGKVMAVHIDGKLRGALAMFRELKADCADAVTPTPMGDLDPEQCREEAGAELILSGGVAPNLWLPESDLSDFKTAVKKWLRLRKYGPRLIANAGDQVPPGAAEDRILLMRDMVEQYGTY